MCHKALTKNKRNLSEPKWKDFITDKILTQFKWIINLLTSVAKDFMTQLQPKSIFSTTPCNLRPFFFFFSCKLLRIFIHKSCRNRPRSKLWLEPGPPGASRHPLSNNPNFQNGTTLSKCEYTSELLDFHCYDLECSNKLTLESALRSHWITVMSHPELSPAGEVGGPKYPPRIPVSRKKHQQWVKPGELHLCLVGYRTVTTLPALSANTATSKRMDRNTNIYNFSFFISVYKRASMQTKLGTTNWVLQSAHFPT